MLSHLLVILEQSGGETVLRNERMYVRELWQLYGVGTWRLTNESI